MPGMKVTVDAAMRARDVSRPRPHHEAAAEQAPVERGRRPVEPRRPPAPPAPQSAELPEPASTAPVELPREQRRRKRVRRRRPHRH
jgi:hypothetical protein